MSGSNSSATNTGSLATGTAAPKHHFPNTLSLKRLVMSTLEEISLLSPSVKLSIIAMKGPPFTRKTEFATHIASSLGCPLLSLEHFLDDLQHSYFQTSSPQPQDLAFQIVCRMAKYHLRNRISKNVVIDSPLSCASHLHQLTELASYFAHKRARVVVVECKPMNVYLWQMKFDEHIARHHDWGSMWYKAKNWEDVEKAIKANEDYEERSVDGHKFVSKLVVDPLLDQPVDDLIGKSLSAPGLIEAVKYMITRRVGDGPDVVVYHQWQQSQYLSSSSSSSSSSSPPPPPPLDEKQDNDDFVKSLRKRPCCNRGHNIISNSTVVERLEYEEVNCMACQKQVMRSGDAYNCKNCSLALHKECGESFDNNNTWGSPFPRTRYNPKYHFPEEFACTSCREMEKGFSDKCASCLFETHLRCRLLPTVINHVDAEEHFLTIVLLPAKDSEIYRCAVCGDSDKFNLYLCKICGVAYHFKCVTLSRRVKHEHGGHHHHLSLKFSSKKAEDYICDECLERRDPGVWFYSCEECVYEVHLSCVHQTSL